MECPVAPNPANPDNENNEVNQGNENNDANQGEGNNDDNNASAGPPNAPPNQPLNHPAPQQPPPNQPAPQQPLSNQTASANPANTLPLPLLHQTAPQMVWHQIINWSHFKPEFTGKPEEDAEAHLLCTNNWMGTHDFEENVKVCRFCLTLLGEARLWYEMLTPIANDWPALHNVFRRQYSKLGNTQEQYFHQWRSFYFDENVDSLDAYLTQVSQCAAMLNYWEPQILELMKNTLPSRLYPILFPINN